jgi:hypothetical protein
MRRAIPTLSPRRRAARGPIAALLALAMSLPGGSEARTDQLPGWFDLAVPGGEPTLAALGMTLEDRAFTLSVLARAFYDREQRIGLSSAGLVQLFADVSAPDAPQSTVFVPAPLDAAAWRSLLPPVRQGASDDLFVRILTDRSALLVAAALASADDSVRAWLARDRDLLRFVYQNAAAFTIAARHLRVETDKVVAPGGKGAERIWEALSGEPPARGEAFLRALLTNDQGRLAWYYDSIAGLDAARLAAVWPETPDRQVRAQALYTAFRDSDPQWRVADQPYRRSVIDAWMVMTQVDVAGAQAASVLPRQTWQLLFSDANVNHEEATRSLRGRPFPVSMEWLVRETLSPVTRERRTRYEMFRLAQRVFAQARPEDAADVAVALSGLRRYRALLLSLERMQVDGPATWVAAVDAARHVNEDASDERSSVVSFQAAIALLERMRHVRTLDRAATSRLVLSLSDAVRANNRVPRSIANWLVEKLIPELPPVDASDTSDDIGEHEAAVLQALAGPFSDDRAVVEWEGLTYTVDPAAAEYDRLRAMRALLPSPGLDAALASDRGRDLSEALTTLVYATALGDPEGPASLSPDVVLRHEFGLNGTTLIREELPWSPPEERQGYGPWRVHGSLFGLDLALARLSLRRIADQSMPAAPTLTLNDLGTLTRTAVALVSSDLSDRDRDELAAAIARGRQRVAATRTTGELVALGQECGMSETTRQLLTWIGSRQREWAPTVFSLRDLLWLGQPALAPDVLDRWGVAAEALDGRRLTAMPGPRPWEDYAGRSEAGQVTTQVPDVTLRLVEETARLKLPAALVPSLLGFALEDYWHDVRARFSDDWPRLTQEAAALSSTRIHDYVAALAGGGPLRAH